MKIYYLSHKYAFRAIIIFFFFLFSFTAFGLGNSMISVNKERSHLIAPEACSYQWFFNGQKLNKAESQCFIPEKTGVYSVHTTDHNGELTSLEVFASIDAAGAIITIFLIGDSTVCNYGASAYPQTGWGQVLPYFFNSSGIKIDNRAIGGRSSRSFYEEGRWTTVRNALSAGDYVFIQFGHNDRDTKPERYTSVADYKKYLAIYINDTRARNAIPVLVSPMVMNAWRNGAMRNVFTEPGNDYRGAMLEVANTMNVPFIDLNMKSWNLYKSLGQSYISRFVYHTYPAGEYPNYPNGITDGTHFQEMGSIDNARMVVQGISELTTIPSMAALSRFLKPQNEIKVLENPNGSAQMTTRTATYPEGLTVTLKTIPKTSATFQRWNNGSGVQISAKILTTVKSGTVPATYTAIYNGATTTCSAAIVASGPTSFCNGESVTLTASAGASYVWKNGTAQVGTDAVYIAKTSGSYTVEVTSATGCKATSASTIVAAQDPVNWYYDEDGDGNGDPNLMKTSCVQPAGYVSDNTDLCPQDKSKIIPGDCGCGKTETSCFDCSQVKNGNAITDECGVCAGGNTGKVPCVLKLQAEDACMADGIINESVNTGYEGAGYVNSDNAAGKAVVFSFYAEAPGNYKLLWRYANGTTMTRSALAEINGAALGTPFVFQPTGSFSAWYTLETQVYLDGGNNMVKLIAQTADGLPNLDYIGFTDQSVTQGSCVITGFDSEEKRMSEFVFFPNPFNKDIILKSKEIFSYSITDLSGKEVESGTGNYFKAAGHELVSGTYILKLQTEASIGVFKIVKE